MIETNRITIYPEKVFRDGMPAKRINLGYHGERNARKYVIDYRPLNDLYGNGRIEAVHKPHSAENPYIVDLVESDEGVAEWTITANDTATVGSGILTIRYLTDNVLKKSCGIETEVLKAHDHDAGEPPEIYDGWIQKATELYEHLKDIGVDPESIKQMVKDIAPEAIEEYLRTHPIESLTEQDVLNIVIAYWTGHKYELKGDKGEQGEKGDPFAYSDFTQEQLAALKGDKGDKGDPGERGVDGKDGVDGQNGRDGADGQPGRDGIDGQDYILTDQDKEDISTDAKNKVLESETYIELSKKVDDLYADYLESSEVIGQ